MPEPLSRLLSPLFVLEGSEIFHRIRGLEADASGSRKWVVERLIDHQWVRDTLGFGYIFLPEADPWQTAAERFGLKSRARYLK